MVASSSAQRGEEAEGHAVEPWWRFPRQRWLPAGQQARGIFQWERVQVLIVVVWKHQELQFFLTVSSSSQWRWCFYPICCSLKHGGASSFAIWSNRHDLFIRSALSTLSLPLIKDCFTNKFDLRKCSVINIFVFFIHCYRECGSSHQYDFFFPQILIWDVMLRHSD